MDYLVNKWGEQMRNITRKTRDRMRTVWGLSARPSRQTLSFLHTPFLPLGAAVLVVQGSEAAAPGAPDDIPMHLVRGTIARDTATVEYGGGCGIVGAYNLALPPGRGVTGRTIDAGYNSSLLRLGLEMDACRAKAVQGSFRLNACPQLPRVYLAYDEKRLPAVADTPTLRAAVARHMERDVRYVDGLDPTARDLLLAAEWPSQFIMPGTAGNTTGDALLPLEFATTAHHARKVYEDFRPLCGAYLWNPAAKVLGGGGCVKQRAKKVDNPAAAVAAAAEIDLSANITADMVTQLLGGMRDAIQPCTAPDDVLLDALAAPDEPLLVNELYSTTQISDVEIIELLRLKLGDAVSAACSNADLLEAARNPGQRLRASGMATIQLLSRNRSVRMADLKFSSRMLGVDRVSADFGTLPEHLQQPVPGMPQVGDESADAGAAHSAT